MAPGAVRSSWSKGLRGGAGTVRGERLGGLGHRGAAPRAQKTASSSTSKTSVALGGISGGAPAAP